MLSIENFILAKLYKIYFDITSKLFLILKQRFKLKIL